MEDLVAMWLTHLGVDEEAGVAQLGDLLGKKFNSLHGVAEDDALVDLELGEECVEAVHLLPLLHVRIILGHSLQGQLIHQVDGIGRGKVLILSELNRDTPITSVS